MLKLKPTCEHCNVALPPSAADAMICSFECTFCARCVVEVLSNVCPNCGGGFERRPVRPARNWHNQNCLEKFPLSAEVVHKPVDLEIQRELVTRVGDLPPHQR